MDFEELIGQKVNKFSIDKDNDKFIIHLHDKKLIYQAVGECCSKSWIEHMDDAPENCTIINVIEKPLNNIQKAGYNQETNDYNDEIDQYFYELITDKGSFTLEMRNENNGYYGGYFRFSREERTCLT